MALRFRIITKEEISFNFDHPDGEFGRVHPYRKWYEIETMMSYPDIPICIKKFRSFSDAQRYSKKHKMEIGEIRG